MPRTAAFNRDTNETKIQVSINLDGGDLLPFEQSDFWDAQDKKNANGESEYAPIHFHTTQSELI